MTIETPYTGKLRDTLFRTAFRAFHVKKQETDDWDDEDDFENWYLEPLDGATLAREYVKGPFEGLFIVEGQIVSSAGKVADCYLDMTQNACVISEIWGLPEFPSPCFPVSVFPVFRGWGIPRVIEVGQCPWVSQPHRFR